MNDAIKHYQRAIQLNPDYSTAHNNLATAYYKKKNWNGAIAEYGQVLRIKPNDPAGHFNLGLALKAAGNRKGALEQFQRAQKHDSGNQQYREAYESLMKASDAPGTSAPESGGKALSKPTAKGSQ